MMSSKINSSNSQILKYPKTVELLSYTFIIFPYIGTGGVENGTFCVFVCTTIGSIYFK